MRALAQEEHEKPLWTDYREYFDYAGNNEVAWRDEHMKPIKGSVYMPE